MTPAEHDQVIEMCAQACEADAIQVDGEYFMTSSKLCATALRQLKVTNEQVQNQPHAPSPPTGPRSTQIRH